MKRRIIGFITAFTLFILFPSPLTADVDKYDFRIIRIAFANGCLRALKADLETIRLVKENKEDLKKYVEGEVDRYMKEVALLNLLADDRQNAIRQGESSKSELWR